LKTADIHTQMCGELQRHSTVPSVTQHRCNKFAFVHERQPHFNYSQWEINNEFQCWQMQLKYSAIMPCMYHK